MFNRLQVFQRIAFIALLAFLSPWFGAEAAEAEDAAGASDPFPGTYRVKGLTTDIRSGDTRRIAGIVVFGGIEDGYYSTKADLETKYPSEGGAVDAHVVGTGTGRPGGEGVVAGKAETQLVLGAVPGLDAEFAFAPRTVGPRIVSTWTAKFRQDGTLIVEFENTGAAGEAYSPTRTKLFGTKIVEPAGE